MCKKIRGLKPFPSNIKYYHVIGDKEKCNGEDICVDENDRLIYTNTLDDYNSLPSKVITALAGIHSKFDFKYVFKTDDDQKLLIGDFFIQLQKAITRSQCHYGGYMWLCDGHISDYYKVHDCLPRDLYLKQAWYATGRFYLLSRMAVEDLIRKRSSIGAQFIEDHAIGLFIDQRFITGALDINTPIAFADENESVETENNKVLFYN